MCPWDVSRDNCQIGKHTAGRGPTLIAGDHPMGLQSDWKERGREKKSTEFLEAPFCLSGASFAAAVACTPDSSLFSIQTQTRTNNCPGS